MHGQGWLAREHQRAHGRGGAHGIHRLRQRLQRLRAGLVQLLASGGEVHAPVAPFKQSHAKRLFQLPQLLRFRRVLGLSVFLYASVHLLLYVWLQMGFNLSELLADVADRAFILMGVLAYALLLPLALTSNNAAIRRMRGANWQALHRLVYLVAGFAIVHFLWMRGTKNDVLEVWIYALILTALMAWRLWHWNRGSSGGSCSH